MKNRWSTSRTEAFSDGVFAIAITLLVLDIHVAVIVDGNPISEPEMWSAIVDEWPAYLGYVTSFLTIGGIWLAHHGIFSRLRFVSRKVIRLNLLLLMFVSFLPFPTRLASEAILDRNTERPAVIFYGLTLFVISVLLGALWTAVEREPELLEPEVTRDEVSSILVMTAPNIALYGAVILLAVFAPRLAALGYLAVGILLVLRARGDDAEALEKSA
jgi:uncharacterized membrane protein